MRRVNPFLTPNFLKSLFEIDLQEKSLWYKRVKAKLILLVVSTYSKTVKNDKNRDRKNNVSLLQSWYGLRLLPGAEEISSEKKKGLPWFARTSEEKSKRRTAEQCKTTNEKSLAIVGEGVPIMINICKITKSPVTINHPWLLKPSLCMLW